jgi:hypothetical protein
MKRSKKRIIAAVAVICALAAGGAAFTASNTLPGTDVAGYGSVTVSGATVSSIHNNLDGTGANITSVDLVFSASQAGLTVQSMFGDESALDSCTDSDPGTDTHWNCAVTHGTGASGAETTANAVAYHVVVSQ